MAQALSRVVSDSNRRMIYEFAMVRFSVARALREWAISKANRERSNRTATAVWQQCCRAVKETDEAVMNAEDRTLQNVTICGSGSVRSFCATGDPVPIPGPGPKNLTAR